MKTFSYSRFNPKVLDHEGRERIGQQIVSLLKMHLGEKKLSGLAVLDIGCADGTISEILAGEFKNVVGVDPDPELASILRKKSSKNLKFRYGDVNEIVIKPESVDVIICNQTYYCVSDQLKLMEKIFRVLKKGGIVFLGAMNSWSISSQRRLHKDFPIRNYWQLKSLCKDFQIYQYTPLILHDPERYGYYGLAKYAGWLKIIPLPIWRLAEPLTPNFIWILEKPKKP